MVLDEIKEKYDELKVEGWIEEFCVSNSKDTKYKIFNLHFSESSLYDLPSQFLKLINIIRKKEHIEMQTDWYETLQNNYFFL